MMRITLAMFAVLSLCTVASADIWLEVDAGAPVAGLPGYTAFTLSAKADAGDYVNAFQGRFDGPMWQVWLGATLPTPDLRYGPDATGMDSRVLFSPFGILAAVGPWEGAHDNSGPPPSSGLGDRLAGADYDQYGQVIPGTEDKEMGFGWANPTYDSIDIARLVVPNTQAVIYEGYIEGSVAGGHVYRGADALVIPEPATMLILAGGAVALIRRRRR